VDCELWLRGVELQAVGAGDEIAFAVVAGDGFDIFVADCRSGGVGGGSLQVVVAAGACFGCCATCCATRYLFDESEMWIVPRCFRLSGTADRIPLGAMR
jgi:hypothetical protein